MQEVLLTVEGISIYTLSAFVFLSFLWSGFVFYKKATEYHESEDVVFNAILSVGILSFVFARLLFVLTRLDWFAGHWIRVLFIKEYPGMNGWGVFLGVLVGALLLTRKRKELFDWLDIMVLGLSAGIPIVYTARGVLFVDAQLPGGMLSYGMIKGLFLALWFFFLWWAEGEYRTFGWYRFRKTQAKTGFVTGAFIFGFGLVNLLVDLLLGGGTVAWYVYMLLVVAGVLIVYIRSERRPEKDAELLREKLKISLIKNSKLFECLRKKHRQKQIKEL